MCKLEKILFYCSVSFLILFIIQIIYCISIFDFSSVEETNVQRREFVREIKEVNLYVEDVFIERNSNIFKKDKFFVKTNGKNSYNRMYISKDVYDKLILLLKEPGIVNFKCEVMDGYFEGKDYYNYAIEILDLGGINEK